MPAQPIRTKQQTVLRTSQSVDTKLKAVSDKELSVSDCRQIPQYRLHQIPLLLTGMEITDLLRRAHEGDADALKSVIPLVYAELKTLASSQLRHERFPGAVQTTLLVHEAFLRLTGSQLPLCENRSHFLGIAARVMRQVLVDMARVRYAAKRGPGLEYPLAELPDIGASNDEAFLALNEALDRLAAQSPLKGQLVELRFFAGMTAQESADELSLPVQTVRRELRLAKAWLQRELA